jgi:amino acid permease
MYIKYVNLQLPGQNLEAFTMISARINSFLITVTFLLLSDCKKSGSQSSNSFDTVIDTVTVPEPGTLLLLAAGLDELALWKSRMK